MAGGSPPRVRGKATKSEKLRRDMRITPACAGKRYTSETNRLTMWDHPRVCGEKADKRVHAPAAAGSPPRVRGKADAVADVVQAIRITPACAGKRVVYQPRRKPRRDHPRVCGEKLDTKMDKSGGTGSPPRVRGKGSVTTMMTAQSRITPACAGKRPSDRLVSYSDRDHPRVCGEKRHVLGFEHGDVGSPPRVRGKGIPTHIGALRIRITPACAGKRSLVFARADLLTDHPRVCGEKTKESLKK